MIGVLAGQTGEIITLSGKVGSSIDAEENIYYGIFPHIQGFESAQIFELAPDRYQARIIVRSGGGAKVVSRYMDFDDYFELKQSIQAKPVITQEIRDELFVEVEEIAARDKLESIPTGQFVRLRLVSGKKISGVLLPFNSGLLNIQTPVKVLEIPYRDIDEISYQEKILEHTYWRKWMFTLGAAIGLGLTEMWNSQADREPDLIWHYRFMGISFGMLGGQELYEAFNILTSPRVKFKFSENEIN